MSTEVRLDDITIGERHRKDLGDVKALADSIAKLGLLHPIVLLPGNKLVVGERRVAAYRLLGRETIPANVAHTLSDLADLVAAECDENTCRKDFTPEEAVAIGLRIEATARPIANERKLSGKSADGTSGGRGKKKNHREIIPKVSQDESKRAESVAAKAVGMSRFSYARAKEVIAAAEEEPEKQSLVEEMNRTGKVNGAFKKLKVEKQAEAIAKEPPPLPTGPFRVLSVDPPWRYGRADDPSHRASNPYPSMSIEEIKAMDVGGLAESDSVLWLWTTNSFLREAFEIAEAWGFEYKTTLTWVKDRMGTGDWLRGQTEHCLLCVKGKPTIRLTNQTTVIHGKLTKHSAKPDEFYAMVEELCPGSKVEVFCRTPREGWHGYGDEYETTQAA